MDNPLQYGSKVTHHARGKGVILGVYCEGKYALVAWEKHDRLAPEQTTVSLSSLTKTGEN